MYNKNPGDIKYIPVYSHKAERRDVGLECREYIYVYKHQVHGPRRCFEIVNLFSVPTFHRHVLGIDITPTGTLSYNRLYMYIGAIHPSSFSGLFAIDPST